MNFSNFNHNIDRMKIFMHNTISMDTDSRNSTHNSCLIFLLRIGTLSFKGIREIFPSPHCFVDYFLRARNCKLFVSLEPFGQSSIAHAKIDTSCLLTLLSQQKRVYVKFQRWAMLSHCWVSKIRASEIPIINSTYSCYLKRLRNIKPINFIMQYTLS